MSNDVGEDFYFDEEWYLRRYPDVKRAIDAGRQLSALGHYLSSGRAEGRQAFGFNENWYLSTNPDLASSLGGFGATAQSHYLAHGRFENRRPVPPVEAGKDQVFAFGAYGTNNVGDEAIFEGLRREYGNVAQIFHHRPTSRRAIGVVDALRYKELFNADSRLVIGGGGLLYNQAAINDMITLAKNANERGAGVELAALGCEGAKPEFHKAIRDLDALAAEVSVRTTTSAEIYRSITGRDATVRDDFAFNLRDTLRKNEKKERSGRPVIGVVTGGDIRLDWSYVLDIMVKNFFGPVARRVNFIHIPHSCAYVDRYNNDVIVGQALWSDFWAATDAGEIQDESRFSVRGYSNDPQDVLALYEKLDGVMTARFHGMIFGNLTDTPTLCLSPNGLKNHSFIKDYGNNRLFAPKTVELTEAFDRLLDCVLQSE